MTSPADTIRAALTKHHAVGYAPVWGERCRICEGSDVFVALTELEQQLAEFKDMVEWDATMAHRAHTAERAYEGSLATVAKLRESAVAAEADRDKAIRDRDRWAGEVETIRADRDRLAADLELIRIGQWNTGTGKNLTVREFARAALDRHTKANT